MLLLVEVSIFCRGQASALDPKKALFMMARDRAQ